MFGTRTFGVARHDMKHGKSMNMPLKEMSCCHPAVQFLLYITRFADIQMADAISLNYQAMK